MILMRGLVVARPCPSFVPLGLSRWAPTGAVPVLVRSSASSARRPRCRVASAVARGSCPELLQRADGPSTESIRWVFRRPLLVAGVATGRRCGQERSQGGFGRWVKRFSPGCGERPVGPVSWFRPGLVLSLDLTLDLALCGEPGLALMRARRVTTTWGPRRPAVRLGLHRCSGTGDCSGLFPDSWRRSLMWSSIDASPGDQPGPSPAALLRQRGANPGSAAFPVSWRESYPGAISDIARQRGTPRTHLRSESPERFSPKPRPKPQRGDSVV